MGHVDEVWDQLDVPHALVARRASASEVARRARPVPRLAPAPTPARCSRTEQRFARRGRRCPTGERVTAHGYADRLELDADGRVVVVDLKTGKYPPERQRRSQRNPQLGLYQLAVDARRGRRACAEPRRPESGGAELVQLAQRRRPAAQGPAAGRPEPERRRPRRSSCAADARPPRLLRERDVPGASPATTADDCDFRADLPDQERRDGALVTASTRRSTHAPRTLRALMGTTYTAQPAAVGRDHRAARARGRDRRRRLGQDHADGGPGGLAGRHRPGRAPTRCSA